MKRRLLALLPLILTLASLVMWVRSQYAGDMWDFPARPVSGPDPGDSSASGPWTGGGCDGPSGRQTVESCS